MGSKHNYDLSIMTFTGLERIAKNPRGVKWDQLILQKETKWIYNLKATKISGPE